MVGWVGVAGVWGGSVPILANGTSNAVYSVFRTFDQQRTLLESIFRVLSHTASSDKTAYEDVVFPNVDAASRFAGKINQSG